MMMIMMMVVVVMMMMTTMMMMMMLMMIMMMTMMMIIIIIQALRVNAKVTRDAGRAAGRRAHIGCSPFADLRGDTAFETLLPRQFREPAVWPSRGVAYTSRICAKHVAAHLIRLVQNPRPYS